MANKQIKIDEISNDDLMKKYHQISSYDKASLWAEINKNIALLQPGQFDKKDTLLALHANLNVLNAPAFDSALSTGPITNLGQEIQHWICKNSTTIQGILTGSGNIVTQIINLLKPVVGTIIGTISAFLAGPVGLIIVAIVTLIIKYGLPEFCKNVTLVSAASPVN